MEYPQDVDVDGHEALKEEGDEIDSESDLTTQLGVMKVDNNRSFYVGEAHWVAVLKDVSYDNGQSYIDPETNVGQIAEVRNFFADHAKQYDDQVLKVQASTNTGDFSQRLGFLFTGTQLPDYTELLASLPSREVTDRLVSRFFNSVDSAVCELITPCCLPSLLTPISDILHPASFQRLVSRLFL